MYRFFVDINMINTAEKKVVITGEDFNHIKNVLRMVEGDEVSVFVSGSEREYRCAIKGFTPGTVELELLFIKESNVELPCEIVLFQALPKADKMEMIITKAVELGVSGIVPVSTKRAVVKLDGARADKKTGRWNAISEAAAKQSKRAMIPEVSPVVPMSEALRQCSAFQTKIIPYELSDPDSMERTRRIIEGIEPGTKVAVFIGPEGGFADEEIEMAKKEGFEPVTLGRRILRTETAGMVVLSWLVYNLEK